jgi:hypothetical protein
MKKNYNTSSDPQLNFFLSLPKKQLNKKALEREGIIICNGRRLGWGLSNFMHPLSKAGAYRY